MQLLRGSAWSTKEFVYIRNRGVQILLCMDGWIVPFQTNNCVHLLQDDILVVSRGGEVEKESIVVVVVIVRARETWCMSSAIENSALNFSIDWLQETVMGQNWKVINLVPNRTWRACSERTSNFLKQTERR